MFWVKAYLDINSIVKLSEALTLCNDISIAIEASLHSLWVVSWFSNLMESFDDRDWYLNEIQSFVDVIRSK